MKKFKVLAGMLLAAIVASGAAGLRAVKAVLRSENFILCREPMKRGS